ncbi:MAG: hypothetical protein ACTSXD_11740 [Candidatus Heimdallarchaeaceae archaeon]
MIKIKEKLREFENIVKIIYNINKETDFTFGTDGIYIRAVDASSTYLGIFEIDKSMFEEYKVEGKKTYTLDVELLLILIRIIGKTELYIDFLEDSIQLSSNTRKFNLKYFVGQKDERPIPSIECTSIWRVKSNEFIKILSEMRELSTLCCLVGGENFMIKIKANMVEGETVTNAEKIRSDECYCYYGLEFFESIFDIRNIFKEIRIGFGKETPCIIKGDSKYLKFRWILAARTE